MRTGTVWAAMISLAAIGLSSGAKLNVPRVLLPFSEEGTNFVLESEHQQDQNKPTCFKWKSSKPELVSVTPINEDPVLGCSSSASVAYSAKGWNKAQSVITAEDINSPGHFLRCDVIVDAIHSLQIVTKTHELFLEEAPEEFLVRAYDDQGNEFTSVQKMIFKWSIDNLVKRKSGSSTSGMHHSDNIRFINFKDSTYLFEDSLRKIEESGRQGRKVLLEGIKTGSSKVSVKLASSLYSKVPPAEVNVMVVANLYLVPGSAYIMIGARIGFYAEQIKSNKIHQIKLPSHQYHVEIGNSEIAKLSKESQSVATGMKLGSTEIFLRDYNLAIDDVIRPPTSDLHIVTPSHILLVVNPYKNWNVIVGNSYEIVVDIFDQNNNNIFPSDNLAVTIEISNEYFDVEWRTQNGTMISGIPLMVGTAEVKATLNGIRKDDGTLIQLDPPLFTSGQLEIYDKIVLNPEIAVFPWHPQSKTAYTLTFQVASPNAGSPFHWTSGNHSVSKISQKGTASTTGDIGEATIRAAMNKASHNFGEATLLTIAAIGMKFVEHRVEVEVGSVLMIPLKLTGQVKGRQIPFTQCHKLPLVVAVTENKVFEQVNPPSQDLNAIKQTSEDTCTAIHVRGLSEGSSEIRASYHYLMNGKQVKLFDTITVSTFKPLAPIQPSSGKTLLAVDSSLHVAWTGGPLPWVMKPDSHFYRLEIDNEAIAEASPRIDIVGVAKNVFAFRVTCLKLGETKVTLYVGNKKSSNLPQPTVVTSSVTVTCGEPDQLELIPIIPQPTETSEPCPLTARTGRIAALANEELEIKTIVIDSRNRKFDNISSLDLDWKLSRGDFGSLKKNQGVEYHKQVHPELGILLATDAYQTLNTNGAVGHLDITATLKKSNYLGFGSISEVLYINFVNEASVVPQVVNVFNHPQNQEIVSIHGGSGYFELVNTKKEVFETRFQSTNQSIQIIPLLDGEGVVLIKDLCLQSKSQTNLRVTTSGIAEVSLLMNDKVQRGKFIDAKIGIFDRWGKLLNSAALKYLDIRVQSSSDIISIEAKKGKEMLYALKGVELGDVSVVAQIQSGSKIINSKPSPVQVFPPLELDPKNVTLIIGSKFQFRTFGGPQPDANVEYSLQHEKIADSNTVGLIEAITLGSTKIVAHSVGFNKISGEKEIFSSDEAEIHVVKFHSIKIVTPLLRIRSGSEMPVYAYGSDEHQNSFSFGTAMPNLELTWSLVNRDAASLVSPFHLNGLSIGKNNNGVMRLMGLKPGRITIKLVAKITSPLNGGSQYQLDKNREFKAQLEIQVYEDLALLSPDLPRNSLLLSPGAEYQLKTNRDNVGHLAYSVLMEDNFRGNSVISVSRNGKVRAGKEPGTASLLIEDREDFGIVQRITLIVMVKPINYMMINVNEEVKAQANVSEICHLPKGMTMTLQVSFHDNTGMEFDATDRQIHYRPSRFDSVLVRQPSNNSLTVNLVKETSTVLKVEDQSRTLQDYLIMRVGKGFSPETKQAYIVGTVIDLDTLVVSKDEKSEGKWIVEPKEKAAINPQTGLCTLLDPGYVRVSYLMDNDQSITVDIEIRQASKLVLRKIEVMAKSKQDQFIPFVVHSDYGNETTNIIVKEDDAESHQEHLEKSSLFDCQAKFLGKNNLNLRDFFEVSAVINLEIPSYACKFTPKPALFSSEAAFLNEIVEVSVVPIRTSRFTLKEVSTTFQFIPGFEVVTEKLQMSNVEPRAYVVTKGLSQILDSLDLAPSLLQHFQVGRGYYEEENVKIFPVYVKSSFWNDSPRNADLSVTVSSNIISDEVIKVPVEINFVTDGCIKGGDMLGWSSLLYFLFSHYQSFFVLVIACVICIYLTKLLTQSKTVSVTSSPGQKANLIGSPRVASPSPMHNSSLNLTNSESKPYLWTVDGNSPVYGSPNLSQRSPRRLAQYSYTEH